MKKIFYILFFLLIAVPCFGGLSGSGGGTFSGAYSDLTGKPTIPSTLAEMTGDSTHRTVTDTNITAWDNAVAGTGGGVWGAITGTLLNQTDLINALNAKKSESSFNTYSTNTASTIAAKAPLDSPAFTGTPTGITATHVGLGNVTNNAQVKKAASSTDGTIPTWNGTTGDALNTGGLTAPSGAIVGTTDTQTISGKTLTKPTINGSVQAVTTDADGATVTFDLAASNIHNVTLAGNRILALSNASTGQVFTLGLVQDATGSRTVTWFSGIKWPAATVPTLTTTAAKTDRFIFICTGAGAYEGYIVGQNL